MQLPLPPYFYRLGIRSILLTILVFVLACQEDTVDPAQFGQIEGVVLDSRTNQPLANASVTTTPATSAYVTDEAGEFILTDAPIGEITITARKTDYRQETAKITVIDGQTVPVTVLLERTGGGVVPLPPREPTPADRATGQVVELRLSWRSSTQTKGDTVRYDVVLYESNSTERRTLLSNSVDTAVVVGALRFNSTYYWQVTARNEGGQVVRGDIWSFQTRSLPDNRFLYVRKTDENMDIYSSDDAGGNLQRLTSSAFVENAPQLSPNRDRIAYTSNVTGQYQLYTMNRDGSDPRRVTVLAVEGYHNFGLGYCWSPDGSQLLYAHYNELYRINRDGTGLTLIAAAPADRHFRECSWTAQGNRVVVQTIGANVFDSEIYLMDADGSNRTLLIGNVPGQLNSPSFSIDGREILYARDVAGFDDVTGRQLNTHVFQQRLDGTNVIDISASSGGTGNISKSAGTNDLYPRYSPDGARIIFVNTVNDGLSPLDIWTADLDGRNRRRLFQNASLPDWK